MARTSVRRPRSRYNARKDEISKCKLVQAHALLLLASAEDEDEYHTALLIAALATMQLRQASDRRRGPYNAEKFQEFFDYILARAPERWFIAWLRY